MENIETTTLNGEKYKWYAIYCSSNHEKKTKENIERELRYAKLENCVPKIVIPTEKVVIELKGKKILREKIVLPCYIFMNADLSNGELLPVIRNTKGVMGFINPSDGRSRRIPEALKDAEVEKFLKIGSDKGEDLLKIKFFINERVKIMEGAFATFEGNIEKIDESKKTLKVIVKIFGRESPVDIEFHQVMKVVGDKALV